MAENLVFRLLTPQGERCSCPCDTVNLWAKDDAQGNGGGSMGFRRGHLPAVVALEEGSIVRAVSGEKSVYAARIRGGFARVDRESVTVLTPGAEPLSEQIE